ncbi:right-handed parallel beta-helix repeat-containing protein [Cellulomonas sp. Sa3CUA2]|uniref:Right-handed parallel beta-helix repeat-containing protein n=1 Tax=Cellulomonas avistercoris TaxID=2762242 RepID=A0ABR8QDP3_9CELL|nr:right-handed parallel beta-helix repeat-containing protein [Cellulomonas avistercoris]MBD7918552.1 right-handed parallel beta-helix repeat-containing protein [Cellulomonas avistercoris]
MRTTRALAAAAGAVVIVVAPATVTTAAPVTVACGDVVTGDVVLTADLVCRGSAVGLTLADGASLDLGGHRLVGDGGATGVAVPGIGDATLRDGVVTGWAAGVTVGRDDQGPGPQGVAALEGLTLRGNDVGVELLGPAEVGPEVHVTSSRLVRNVVGIRTGAAGRTWVRSSHLTDNGTGAQVVTGTWLWLSDSVVARNGTGLRTASELHVHASTLRDNATALACDSGTGDVEDSTFARNGVGVDCGVAASLDVTGSTLRDNGTAVRLDGSYATLTANRFVRNEVGFVAVGGSGNARLADNELRRNGDGILSVPAGSALEGNTAVNNERWGIHAPGAVDLGGNTARGNGNEPQCVGVVCGGAGPAS